MEAWDKAMRLGEQHLSLAIWMDGVEMACVEFWEGGHV
jgi:hypothetical protein